MESYQRGKSFELRVAKMTRQKIDKSAKRNPGSHANWVRRGDIYTDLPYHIEAKDQETIRPKEWYRQAEEASFGRTPLVAFQMEQEVMCMLRYDDFLNLLVELADLKSEIEDLRKPVVSLVQSEWIEGYENIELKPGKVEIFQGSPKLTDGTLRREITLCKSGHIISPGRDTCMTKGCQYSSTYIKPKAKKESK